MPTSRRKRGCRKNATPFKIMCVFVYLPFFLAQRTFVRLSLEENGIQLPFSKATQLVKNKFFDKLRAMTKCHSPLFKYYSTT